MMTNICAYLFISYLKIYIVNCFIGSLKTRIGSAPDREQFEILYDIIEHYVNKNIPIDTILTWGPKKFFSGQENYRKIHFFKESKGGCN